MLPELLAGTQAMLQNLDPTQTLEQVFDQRFYTALGIEKEAAQPLIESFYAEVFPSLRELVAPREGAADLVKHALEAKLEIVIATNPLFPRTAILQRLDWGNLAPEQHPYDLITSYEHFHFAKPHREYFAEVLARLGRNPHQALMIGDDLSNDIDPCLDLGIAVYHLSEAPRAGLEGGNLAGALEWLGDQIGANPTHANHDPESLLARLRASLAASLSMLEGLDPSQWTIRPERNEWAPVEILCHLRDVELEINLPRYEAILARDQPFLSAFDPDRWAVEREYLHQSGQAALEVFKEARIQALDLLQRQADQQWARSARHSLLGPIDLDELVSITVEHDTLHLRQLRQTLTALIGRARRSPQSS
jgi:HAD superfamily hydrolase (TIGR01549 family)